MPLVDYDAPSSDEEGVTQSTFKKASVVAAPSVSTQDPSRLSLVLSRDSEKMLSTNLTYEDMSRPLQGPMNPFSTNGVVKKNVITGFVEADAVDEAYFRQQYETHGKRNGHDLSAIEEKERARARKRKRESKGDLAVLDGEAAWKGPWAKYEVEAPSEDDDEAGEQSDYEPEVLAPSTRPEIDRGREIRIETNHGAEQSEFYGESIKDYLGRTYMHVPQDLDIDLRKRPGEEECFVPKRKIHTFEGHQKGISALRFFPNSGHLLLSASVDSKIMLWDCHHDRALLRDYCGHSKAVRDICFTPDGKQFLSAAFDTQMKLWDTETGKCVSKFSSGKIPYTVKIHPDAAQHEFLAGMSNNKILQYDLRSGEMVQEYNHHLGPVNTITFIDGHRRFITTSDDKSLRAWEYGIPVPIKLIAEPEMHSMPSVAAHPGGKYIACQSLDNQVVSYSAIDKIKVQRRKQFRGHGCNGYGIEVSFSPDGKYLSSGDAGGYACFWDWKTCQLVSKFAAHKGPLTQIQWHPQETSKVATGGVDGMIHYWD